jgi:hypothetical protein
MNTINIQITLTEDEIKEVLRGRTLPADWNDYLDYLSEALANALQEHLADEIIYLTEVYRQEVTHEDA